MPPLTCYWPRAVIHVQADRLDTAPDRQWLRQALMGLSPDLEVHGAAEAVIDVTHFQQSQGSPECMARRVQQRVYEVDPGVRLRVGVSSTKTLARYAGQLAAPGGLVVIRPWEAKQWLARLPIEKIQGVGEGLQRLLSLYRVTTCAGVSALPLEQLVRRYGEQATRLRLTCQGQDPEMAHRDVATFTQVLPPQCDGRRAIAGYLRQLSRKLAAHLRRFDMQAGRLTISMRMQGAHTAVHRCFALNHDTDTARYLGALAHGFLATHWHGKAVTHLQFSATDLRKRSGQLELFAARDVGQGPLQTPVDEDCERSRTRAGCPPLSSCSEKQQQQHAPKQQAVDHKRQHAHALQ